ncbi:HAD family hydrolase [Streptomyces sp. AgN23]|nr:HAD family hydrolase [Streptomyces sp. AgN23]
MQRRQMTRPVSSSRTRPVRYLPSALAEGCPVKETGADAVAELRGLDLRPVLLTGDNQAAAESVARAVGIDEVIAEVLPQDKVDVIKRLQDDGLAGAASRWRHGHPAAQRPNPLRADRPTCRGTQ